MCVCLFVCRALPVMFSVALDLRIFANNVRIWSVVIRVSILLSSYKWACVCLQAEQQLQKKSKGQPSEMLEKAAEHLMSCFRICASDKWVSTKIPFNSFLLTIISTYFCTLMMDYGFSGLSVNVFIWFLSTAVPGLRTQRSGEWCSSATSSLRSTLRSKQTMH